MLQSRTIEQCRPHCSRKRNPISGSGSALLTVPCHLTLLSVHSPGYCHVPRWWLLHHQYQPQQQYQQRLQQEEQALLMLPD